MAILNRVGKKYGRLTVIKFSHIEKRNACWLCKCDCGNEKIVSGHSLQKENTRSCGCLKKSHGFFGTKFYIAWINLNVRCRNKNNVGFKYYGGRGIKVCKRWRKFENFRDDMHESYLKHVEEFGIRQTTIDRIDSNKNYYKENCRWATITEQNRNKRSNIRITIKGKTLTLKEWSRELNLSVHTVTKKYVK